MNVIGDIAGQYDALMALLRKMPDQETLSVGDMIDRGPKSREVVQWFMRHGNALLGNHEHMMMDWYFQWGIYDRYLWEMNGGVATRDQYDGHLDELARAVDWMSGLRIFAEHDEFFISHAFIRHRQRDNTSMIWGRGEPVPGEMFQIAGHNSHFGLRFWARDDVVPDHHRAYALSIDTSASDMLCGVDTNTMRIYTQEYI